MSFVLPFRRTAVLVTAAILAVALGASALAHVSVNPGEALAGSYTRLDFRVGHACDGSPTTSLRVQIPSGVESVQAENKPGWTADVVTGELDEPYESNGETVTEGVIEVVWSGGSLPDHLFEDFGISARMPDRPGETLYFPVIQECEAGELAWIQIPAEGEDAHDFDEPAPALQLVDSAGNGHGQDGDVQGDGEAAGVTAQNVASDSASTSTVAWLALSIAVVGFALGAAGTVVAVRRR